jgi:hypothetical protein
VRFSLAGGAPLVLCFQAMRRDAHLFVLGHLILLAIAVIGSL